MKMKRPEWSSWFASPSDILHTLPPPSPVLRGCVRALGQGWRHSSMLPPEATGVLFRDLPSGKARTTDCRKEFQDKPEGEELELTRGAVG